MRLGRSSWESHKTKRSWRARVQRAEQAAYRCPTQVLDSSEDEVESFSVSLVASGASSDEDEDLPALSPSRPSSPVDLTLSAPRSPVQAPVQAPVPAKSPPPPLKPPPKRRRLVPLANNRVPPPPPPPLSLLDRFRPRVAQHIMGRKYQLQALRQWLKTFPKPRFPLAILSGPPGTGKTTLAHVLLREFHYEVIEINASDERTYAKVRRALINTCGTDCVRSNRRTALLLEEVDGGYQDGDGNSPITALRHYFGERHNPLPFPVLATCNVSSNLKPLFPLAVRIHCSALPAWALEQLCRNVEHQLNIGLGYQERANLIRLARGDARRIINELGLKKRSRIGVSSTSDIGDNPFIQCRKIFQGGQEEIPQNHGYLPQLLFHHYPQILENAEVADLFSMCDMMHDRDLLLTALPLVPKIGNVPDRLAPLPPRMTQTQNWSQELEYFVRAGHIAEHKADGWCSGLRPEFALMVERVTRLSPELCQLTVEFLQPPGLCVCEEASVPLPKKKKKK